MKRIASKAPLLLSMAISVGISGALAAQEFVKGPLPEPVATEAPAPAPEAEAGAEVAPGAEPVPEVNAAESSRDGAAGAVLPELLAAVAAERAALNRRALALDKREAELAFAAAALSAQDQQLSQLKDEIERLLGLAEASHTEDVTRLVRIYRAMKPADAAAILSDADLEVSVLVIAAMAERDSGPILAKMNKVRAQAISKIILERSRLPGDQNLVNLKVN